MIKQIDKNEHTFVPKIASKTHVSWKEDEYELQLAEQELMRFYAVEGLDYTKWWFGSSIHWSSQAKYKF